MLHQRQAESRRYWLTGSAPDEVRDLYIDPREHRFAL